MENEQKENFDEKTINFWNNLMDNISNDHCKNNSLLIISNCPKDWLKKAEQSENPLVQRAIRIFNNRHLEFFLNQRSKSTLDPSTPPYSKFLFNNL